MFEVSGDDGAVVVERLRETERLIAVLQAEQLELMQGLYRLAPGWISSDSGTPGLVDAAEVAAAEIGGGAAGLASDCG